ncbi:Crp/Fnr family transcriptional regulator [Soonwooa purpurea]
MNLDTPVFRHVYQHFMFSEDDLERIAASHVLISISKGETILKSGEILDSYYLLESGIVRAFVHDFDMNEMSTEFFINNEIVIIPSSLFQRIASQETLQAVTDCKLWQITYDDFQVLFQEIPGFADWGRMWFTFQLFSLKQRSLDMIMEPAKNRYLKLLKERPSIVQNVPLKQIATYLGITDTSLSRIRKELVKV